MHIILFSSSLTSWLITLFFFPLGAITDDHSISYESDRRSPCTLFSGGWDQSGTAPPFPPVLKNHWPCIDNPREWINEPNAWYTIRWSTWHAKPTAHSISWSHPSCCLTWCITKGWRSCVWIMGSGYPRTRTWARWWTWLMDMLQVGGIKGKAHKYDMGLFGPCGVRKQSFLPFFFKAQSSAFPSFPYPKLLWPPACQRAICPDILWISSRFRLWTHCLLNSLRNFT